MKKLALRAKLQFKVDIGVVEDAKARIPLLPAASLATAVAAAAGD